MTAIRPRFVLCVPDLDLSFYWTLFRQYASPYLAGAGYEVLDQAVASTERQETALAGLALRAGDVLALRPVERGMRSLHPHLARLREAGARILLLGELEGLAPDLAHARVLSDHAAGLAAALDHACPQAGGRALLFGSTPHVRIGAASLHDAGADARQVADAPDCPYSQPQAMYEHALRHTGAALAAGQLGNGDVVLAVDDVLAQGAADAAAEADVQLHVVGAGATPAGLRALGEGRIRASLFFDPAQWLGMLVAALGQGAQQTHRVPGRLIDAHELFAFQAEHAPALLAILDATTSDLRSARHDAHFFEAVVENMPAMVFVKRMPDLRFHLVNKERERWLGIDRAQIIGRTAYDFWAPEMADLYTRRDLDVLQARTIIDQPVVPMTRTDGQTRYVLTRKIPLLDANGHPEFLVGISLDVTERELAERELARRQRELEEAHAALQANQQQLLLAEKMAALGRITAGIAHEINTPLAAIRAALAELQALAEEYEASSGDPEVTPHDHREIAAEMRRSIGIADKSAERAASFVRGIKQHTRSREADQKIWFELAPALQESLVLLDHVLRAQRCVPAVRVDGAPRVLGTPGWLSHIMTNLLTNAVDARAPDRPLHIEIEAVVGAREVRLSVRDNGVGIAPADMSRIFEPMFTTKPFGQGTGLGLAIVHALMVEQFGGRIEAHSTPGDGARFDLYFPLDTAS